jgi:hypothetical protein
MKKLLNYWSIQQDPRSDEQLKSDIIIQIKNGEFEREWVPRNLNIDIEISNTEGVDLKHGWRTIKAYEVI